jgi:acetyl-CoA carboxylase carboxyltransferase component
MGAESAAPIIFRRELENAHNSEEVLQAKIKQYRDDFANPYKAAENLHIDDIIDPAQTRPRLIATLEQVLNKTEDRPKKKHGIMPT